MPLRHNNNQGSEASESLSAPSNPNTRPKEISAWRLQLHGFCTILRKEIVRVLRIWTQTLLPSVITSTLYFMIFGKVIGGHMELEAPYSFIEFIAPGLVIMALLNNAYANTSSSVFGLKFSRAIEEELVSPLKHSTMIIGHTFGGFTRGILVGGIVTLISLFFTPLKILHPWIMLSTAMMTALLFSLAGFLNALLAKRFDHIAIIPSFVLTPLTYLGGIFYSIDALTPFWQTLARLNPILYVVNTFRYCMLGTSDVDPLSTFMMLAIFIVALWMLCLRMVKNSKWLRL